MKWREFITLLGGAFAHLAARGKGAAGSCASDRIFKYRVIGVRCRAADRASRRTK
jgi:hypothetical protein